MLDFEGDWEDNSGEVLTIRNGCLATPDGTELGLSIASAGVCEFSVEGLSWEGRLDGDRLLWSDGAVWTRRRAPRTPGPIKQSGVEDEEEDDEDGEAKRLEAALRQLGAEEPDKAEDLRLIEPHQQDDAPPSPLLSPSAPSQREPTALLEVLVRHATEDWQLRVRVPPHAKFKHVRRALGRRVGVATAERALLTHKVHGRYRASKDEGLVGEVRQVLVSSVVLPPTGREELEEVVADLSDCEAPASNGLDFLRDLDREGQEDVDEGTGAREAASSSAPSPATRGNGAGKLTLEEAKNLQRELLEGYREFRFQQRLESLDRVYGAFPDCMEFQQERQEVLLGVQKEVLPRYGFEGTLDGVYRMIGCMGPFLEDTEFTQLAKEINKTLGIRSPQATWNKLSQDCNQLNPPEAAGKKSRVDLRRLVPPSADGDGPKSLLPPVPPYVKVPAAPPASGGKVPAASSKAAPTKPGQGLQLAAKEGTLDFESYPAGRVKPYKLFVAGSWNNFSPMEMHWQRGLFVSAVTIGSEGVESFQLLKNGKWSSTIYPSISEASLLEEHDVCGPDGDGHGRNWTIGRYSEEAAAPGRQFAIIAALDKQAVVRLVHWQPM